MFSGASTAFGAPPNTQASALDIALPGTLPVANARAVEHAIRFGLAVKGQIRRRSVFARKNYFYPDLPKGYQISQYELPIVAGGEVKFFVDREETRVRLTRAHLEEDAGKLLHELSHGMTGVDLNRAGTPLLEIVSEPELRGAKEAVAYARALHGLVMWIGICDGNMQEGSFRCDANVSVKKQARNNSARAARSRTSIRSASWSARSNSRRAPDRAARGRRQSRAGDPALRPGARRDALHAHEGGRARLSLLPDPDLLPLVLREEQIKKIASEMPELPDATRERFARQTRCPRTMPGLGYPPVAPTNTLYGTVALMLLLRPLEDCVCEWRRFSFALFLLCSPSPQQRWQPRFAGGAGCCQGLQGATRSAGLQTRHPSWSFSKVGFRSVYVLG